MACPPVSLLVTTCNHVGFVDECLASVSVQTTQDFELVITDDASDDGTAERIDAWLAATGRPARFTRNPTRRGLCANRNQALANSHGALVCSLSGDDAFAPDRIERQWRWLSERPAEVAAVVSDAQMIDADGHVLQPSFLRYHLGGEPFPEGDRLFERILLKGNFMPAPAIMVRRAALEAVGGYDESLFYEDFYMWLELSRRYRFDYLDASLVCYRILPNSMSHGPAHQRSMYESELRILASWLERCGALQPALVERLWERGDAALDREFFDLAQRAYTAAAAASPGAVRRMAALALTWPGVASAKSWARRARAMASRAKAGVSARVRASAGA